MRDLGVEESGLERQVAEKRTYVTKVRSVLCFVKGSLASSPVKPEQPDIIYHFMLQAFFWEVRH